MDSLKCRYCGENKAIGEFAPSHRSRDVGTCRQCNTERMKEYRHQKQPNVNDQLSLSAFSCSVCGVEKLMVEYRWNPKSGYKTECKDCEQLLLRCTDCKVLKAHEDFPVCRKVSTGRHSLCRQCHNRRTKEKYATDPEFRKKHKEQSRSEKAKQWRKENWQKTKESQKEFHRVYSNWKYHNDPLERNKIEARSAVNFAVKFGFLKRPDTCQSGSKYGVECGGEIQGHHHKGYDRENWLEVEWLCVNCHKVADMLLRDGTKAEDDQPSLGKQRTLWDS